MKIKTIAQTILAASIAVATGAQAYQVELNGNYKNTSVDNVDADTDAFGLAANYYFEPVRVGNNPHAEAEFLGKASNIGLVFGKESVDNVDEDTDTLGINGDLYMKQSPLYFGAEYSQKEKGDVDTDTLTARIGYFVQPNFLLTAGVRDNDEETDPTLSAKYVGSTGSNFYNLEASTVLADDTGINLGADFYIDRTLSVGIDYADSGADGEDGTVGINARKFFTPAFGAGISYATGDDKDTIGLNLTGRF